MSLATDNNLGIPAELQAEQNLLGSLISGAAALADLLGFHPEWFADPVHTAIYKTIEAQVANHSSIDIGTLSSILAPCSETTGGIEPGCVLEEVGGAGYLAELAARPAPPIAISSAAVRDAWLCRELIDLGQTIAAMVFDGNGSDALHAAMRGVAALAVAIR